MAKNEIKISNHVLSPKHTKLSESEKKIVLEKYNVELKNLPAIRINDAALEGMDVKVNDVIKIERDSPTAGKSYFYRSVTE